MFIVILRKYLIVFALAGRGGNFQCGYIFCSVVTMFVVCVFRVEDEIHYFEMYMQCLVLYVVVCCSYSDVSAQVMRSVCLC